MTNTGEVVKEDGKTFIKLYGGGPKCPGCGGPTYRVAEDEYEHPWWCQDCNVRFDEDGNYGNSASFPAGSEPDE